MKRLCKLYAVTVILRETAIMKEENDLHNDIIAFIYRIEPLYFHLNKSQI